MRSIREQVWQDVTTRHDQWRRAQVGDNTGVKDGNVVQDQSAQVFQRPGGGTRRGCVAIEIDEITEVGIKGGGRVRQGLGRNSAMKVGGGVAEDCGLNLVGRQGGRMRQSEVVAVRGNR